MTYTFTAIILSILWDPCWTIAIILFSQFQTIKHYSHIMPVVLRCDMLGGFHSWQDSLCWSGPSHTHSVAGGWKKTSNCSLLSGNVCMLHKINKHAAWDIYQVSSCNWGEWWFLEASFLFHNLKSCWVDSNWGQLHELQSMWHVMQPNMKDQVKCV